MAAPRATYRLQLHAGFDLDQAAALVDYLAALGVSHVYTSPLHQAAAGSTHGYDVVDHARVNRELGGEPALHRLGEQLAAHGMGLVVDVVPNHMAIDRENAWWWDVLENGPSSHFAAHFDVDWELPEARLCNLVLVPILGDHYGRVLEAGELRLAREGARFEVRYHEHALPVAPRSLDDPLRRAAERAGSEELAFVADAFGRLPLATATDRESVARRHRDKRVLGRLLGALLARRRELARAVDDALAEINADHEALHALLERQNWRVARWRVAERDLGYRRFFDLAHLVAVRIEDPRVFDEVHAGLRAWRGPGRVEGLRIDHVDGLRDPEAYLRRLRAAFPGAWVVVEKILGPEEELPAWPVAGTTGYEFLNRVGGLFVDPAGEKPTSELYTAFTGDDLGFEAVVVEQKDEVLRHGLGADLGRLTALAVAACERHLRYRDFTRHELHEALAACVVHFPVYRSYMRAGDARLRDADAEVIGRALAAARESRPELDTAAFDFVEGILRREISGPLENEILLRFQQLTGPAQAKGVEDAAFYRWNRLVSLNEVGGDPAHFGTRVAEFHAASRRTLADWPETLLATSTHDTKRGEDVRARIHLLSEIPERFEAAVRRFAELGQRHKTGALPDRGFEWLLYQTLVGAWPISAERMLGYAEKAAREAKLHTSWTDPDPRYEEAVQRFVAGALADEAFVAELDAFVAPLVAPGRVNALAQTLFKLTAPGVPDLYQGSELWDSSLVDPDNRRPVDFAARRAGLAALDGLDAAGVLARADLGLPKLHLVRCALALRARRPEAFGPEGDYAPLEPQGERAEHVVAFARGGVVAAVAPRLVLGLARAGGFGATELTLPPGRWRDVLTGRRHAGGPVRLADLLAGFPVALLEETGA